MEVSRAPPPLCGQRKTLRYEQLQDRESTEITGHGETISEGKGKSYF